MEQLSNLFNKHNGQDIFVIGSGASLNYIGKRLFEDKVVICVNNTINHIPHAKSLYVVTKEPSTKLQDTVKQRNSLLVTCEYHSGGCRQKNIILHPDNTIIFNPVKSSIEDKENLDSLTISASTITTAIHLGAFMGAKCLFLVGCDCGSLDGKVHVDDYDKATAMTSESNYSKWMNYNNVEHNTLRLKKILNTVWNCDLHSINPFINFSLENHTYRKF